MSVCFLRIRCGRAKNYSHAASHTLTKILPTVRNEPLRCLIIAIELASYLRDSPLFDPGKAKEVLVFAMSHAEEAGDAKVLRGLAYREAKEILRGLDSRLTELRRVFMYIGPEETDSPLPVVVDLDEGSDSPPPT